MNDSPLTDNSLDDLAEEFARRCRGGERPSVEDYAARYPQWADDIREMFPAVLMMERLKPTPSADSGAKGESGVPHSEFRAPSSLGEYRILREIGRGGMGVVYEALQEPLGRRVAIKVLPAQLFANEKLRSRFRRESQAAARLHHTNIVPVFAVGEQDGLCYYVMQLIAGHSIDAALTTEGGQISAKEVAHIGVQVADALAYAHGQGVLHRDIKPSNLLIDGDGAVWVTDFGVAKLVEESNLTQSGDLVGTLKYMPPERFLGRSDACGDVYGLGITLYEMLARRPAFPDTTPQHLIQLITEAEPAPPRKLDPTIPIDLETIVLKAAARDPARRYQTAAELADDLRRFLDERPVRARRVGTVEQIWRWCGRNRRLAAAGAAVLALLLITTVVTAVAYVRTSAANREADAAIVEMKKALAAEQDARERAENTSASALEALNRIFDRFAPNRIVVTPALPAEGSNEEEVNVVPPPVMSPEAVPLLKELLGSYEKFAREGGEHPKLRLQAAEANQRIGDIRQRLGEYELAISAYRKALDLYAQAPAEKRDATAEIKVARTYNEMGRALRALQRTDEARDAHGQALATLTEAPGELAPRPEYRYELARTYYLRSQREFLGGSPPPGGGPGRGGPDDFGRGPPPGGRGPGRGGPDDFGRGGPKPPGPGDNTSSKQAITLLEGLVKEHPAVPEYRHLLACCYRDAPPPGPGGRGGPPPGPGNPDRALDLLRQLVKEFPKVPDYRYELCETLVRACVPGPPGMRGTTSEPKQLLEEAIKLSGDLVAEYPNVPQYAASRAQVHDRLGVLLHEMKQLEEAEGVLRKGVGIQAELVKQHGEVTAYNFSLALMQASLARVLSDRGKLSEARTLLEASAKRLESLLTKDEKMGFLRMFIDHRYRELAQVLTKLGEKDLAAEAQKKAEAFGPPPRERRGDRP
jgi:tetratricopeptide (TPR) repeat protein